MNACIVSLLALVTSAAPPPDRPAFDVAPPTLAQAVEAIWEDAEIATDEGLPEAKGQTYTLPAGAFFAFKDGKISRVTNCYSLNDWIAQVQG